MLKILLAENSGFCFGVQRSLNLVKTVFNKDKVYLLGPLIHNNLVIKKLEEKGAIVVKTIKEIPENTVVIIRAHGVAPEVYLQAKQKNLKIIDATCPFVKMVQDKAKSLNEKGYLVVIVGEKEHPEVKGILGNAVKAVIIEKPAEVNSIFNKSNNKVSQKELEKKSTNEEINNNLFLPAYNKIGVVSQTTQSNNNFAEIVKQLCFKGREVRAFNTICNATHQRQHSALEIAKKSDLMLVIGDKSSGNTKRLFELCSQVKETKWIESVKELQDNWFENVKVVGVTAGASTPKWVIDEVIKLLEKVK
ncbi:MAG: 4-hydroxy-3-methylbut-2-enyl diphosphate reductase [archaeon]